MKKTQKQTKPRRRNAAHRLRKGAGHFNQRQFGKICRAIREDVLKNRSDYAFILFATLEKEIVNVERAADEILEYPEICFPEEFSSVICGWYSFTGFHFYLAPLADHLDYEEERRLTEDVGRQNAAWQKFLSTVRLRKPALAARCDAVQALRDKLGRYYLELYRGELSPVLPLEYLKGGETLKCHVDAILAEFNREDGE